MENETLHAQYNCKSCGDEQIFDVDLTIPENYWIKELSVDEQSNLFDECSTCSQERVKGESINDLYEQAKGERQSLENTPATK